MFRKETRKASRREAKQNGIHKMQGDRDSGSESPPGPTSSEPR